MFANENGTPYFLSIDTPTVTSEQYSLFGHTHFHVCVAVKLVILRKIGKLLLLPLVGLHLNIKSSQCCTTAR